MSLAFQERFKDRIAAVGRQGELQTAGSVPVSKDLSKRGTQSLPISPSLPFVRPIRLPRSPSPFPPFVLDKLSSVPPKPVSLQTSETQSTLDFRTSLAGSSSESIQLSNRALPDHTKKPIPSPRRSATPKRSPSVIKDIERPALVGSISQASSTQVSIPGSRTQFAYAPYTLKDYHLIKPTKYLPLGGLGPFMIGTQEWMKKKELDSRRKTYGQQVLATNSSRLSLNASSHQLDHQDAPFSSSSSRQRALDFARSVHPPSAKFPRLTIFLDKHL